MTEDFVEKVKNTVGPDTVEPVNPQPEIIVDSAPQANAEEPANRDDQSTPQNPEA